MTKPDEIFAENDMLNVGVSIYTLDCSGTPKNQEYSYSPR